MAAADRLGLFGIRHHGPGSARSLVAALDALDPAIVLVEGPADVGDLLPWAAAPGMTPPIAILVHDQDDPSNARFYPFALYSPEWQALCWAAARGRPARFIDLPAEFRLAPPAEAAVPPAEDEDLPAGDASSGPDAATAAIRSDPLGHLAAIAGYGDGESWWNAVIEQGGHGPAVFAAIETAMTELRQHVEAAGGDGGRDAAMEACREAHMRLAVAAALKETEGAVAVVCGAWHVPALRLRRTLAQDRAVLKGLARVKVAATWVPWTETRLAAASGYGAGVISPGWYAHLWSEFARRRGGGAASAHEFTARWQVRVAALLRRAGRPASTASVIEAARLSEALAALRDLAMPGLDEMREASLAALCWGETTPMALIEAELVVGRGVGTIAEGVPQMPLAADLARWQKRLKLKPEALDQEITLDLRSEAGLAKSLLLHRLDLIGVPWGRLLGTGTSRGTFRENWRLRWDPEFSVRLAEALVHGTTIEQAAGNAAVAAARQAAAIADVAEVVRGCLLAGLDEAARAAIALLQARAAGTSDVAALAGAVPPLAAILRYGTARAIPTEELGLLVVGLAEAVSAGLVHACRALQPPEAEALGQRLADFDRALVLVDREGPTEAWIASLAALAADADGDDLLRGLAVRTLYDRGRLDAGAAGGHLSRALSPAAPPLEAGRWLEGFLGRAGDLLLHDAALRAVIDGWLVPLDEATFVAILPMLRRAFGALDPTERRRLLDTLRRAPRPVAGAPAQAAPAGPADDTAPGFKAALPLLFAILGLDREEQP